MGSSTQSITESIIAVVEALANIPMMLSDFLTFSFDNIWLYIILCFLAPIAYVLFLFYKKEFKGKVPALGWMLIAIPGIPGAIFTAFTLVHAAVCPFCWLYTLPSLIPVGAAFWHFMKQRKERKSARKDDAANDEGSDHDFDLNSDHYTDHGTYHDSEHYGARDLPSFVQQQAQHKIAGR
jgi:hypothetical protein